MGGGAALSPAKSQDVLLRETTPTDGAETTIAGNTGYRVYKRRWFGLIQLVLLNIVVGWDVCSKAFRPDQPPSLSLSLLFGMTRGRCIFAETWSHNHSGSPSRPCRERRRGSLVRPRRPSIGLVRPFCLPSASSVREFLLALFAMALVYLLFFQSIQPLFRSSDTTHTFLHRQGGLVDPE